MLFVPKFLIDIQTSTFFPDFSTQDSFGGQLKYFFRRDNVDPFRISIDWLLLSFVLLIIKRKLPHIGISITVILLYLIWFFYQLYHGILHTLYNQDALLYNDYFLLLEGLSLIKAEAGWWLVIGLITMLVALIIVVLLLKFYVRSLKQVTLSVYSKLILLLLFGLSIASTIDYRTRLLDERLAFPIASCWIIDNVIQSTRIYHSLQDFEPSTFNKYHDYKDFNLIQKPNLHIIFIESYGSLLYEHPSLQKDYQGMMDKKQKVLSNAGWMVASGLSESPVTGGRSWLAYTSFLIGAKIDRHKFYQYFINNPQFNIPTLFKSLKHEGYYSYWLSVIEDKRGDIPYDDYQNFYGFDEWIRFDDLNYKGKRFGAFTTPPDQYSLNFAYDKIKADSVGPYCLFFISLNSHHPFHTPTHLEKDWQELALRQEQHDNREDQSIEKAYGSAINYQFDYLTEFIVKKGTTNDLFILIGDHQPPMLSNQYPSMKTPFHIVGKDTSLVQSFYKYGLSSTLKIHDRERKFSHTGFYSMIMRELYINFAASNVTPPAFLPEGAPWQSTE